MNTAIIMVLVAGILGGIGPIFLKKSAGAIRASPKTWLSGNLVLGVVLYASGVFLYTAALRTSDLTVIYPLVSLSYVWSALFSQRFLDERMNLHKWVGIIFILFGTMLIGIGTSGMSA